MIRGIEPEQNVTIGTYRFSPGIWVVHRDDAHQREQTAKRDTEVLERLVLWDVGGVKVDQRLWRDAIVPHQFGFFVERLRWRSDTRERRWGGAMVAATAARDLAASSDSDAHSPAKGIAEGLGAHGRCFSASHNSLDSVGPLARFVRMVLAMCVDRMRYRYNTGIDNR